MFRFSFRCSSCLVFVTTLIGWVAVATIARGASQEHDETPMQLSGLSVSQAFEIKDDQPLDPDLPLIKQLLYRIKKSSPKSRWELSQYTADLSWEDLSERTEDFRLWVFNRKARLKLVEKHGFDDALPGSEIKGLYICHCEDQQGRRFLALARSVPRWLRNDKPTDEPIGITGMLFARASRAHDALPSSSNAENLPVFIIDRLAWYPDKPRANEITDSHVELATHGVDIGLLDHVREANTRPLGTSDSEAFFQMIAGVQNIAGNTTIPPIGFVDLQKNSSAQIGNAIEIQGLVRSCTKIPVTDTDIRERIGISHYYQLILFPNLKGGKILIQDKSGDSQEFTRYPITVCCSRLPDGMSPTDMERKPFLIEGFFFRFWRFQSEKTDLAGKSGLASPLIMASVVTPVKSQVDRLNMILLVFVVAVILGIATLLWAYRKSDQKQKILGESLLDSLPEKIDVTGFND